MPHQTRKTLYKLNNRKYLASYGYANPYIYANPYGYNNSAYTYNPYIVELYTDNDAFDYYNNYYNMLQRKFSNLNITISDNTKNKIEQSLGKINIYINGEKYINRCENAQNKLQCVADVLRNLIERTKKGELNMSVNGNII